MFTLPEGKAFYTEKETAELLSLSLAKIKELRRAGVLEFLELKPILITKSMIEDFVMKVEKNPILITRKIRRPKR